MIKNRKILIVDDDADLRYILAREFVRMGLDVAEAANGIEALDRLTERPAFDIVVTDLAMPKMGGAELIRIAGEQDYAVRFIVHSGSVTTKAACGIPEHVPVFDKGIDSAALVEHVRKRIGRAA